MLWSRVAGAGVKAQSDACAAPAKPAQAANVIMKRRHKPDKSERFLGLSAPSTQERRPRLEQRPGMMKAALAQVPTGRTARRLSRKFYPRRGPRVERGRSGAPAAASSL